MDPELAWKELARAIDERRWSDVELRCGELLAWFKRGGEPPRLGYTSNADTLRLMASAVCHKFLRIARRHLDDHVDRVR